MSDEVEAPEELEDHAPDGVVRKHFSHPLLGETMEWEKRGRGVGTYARGEVIMFIPAGTNNEDAVDLLQEYRRDLVIRPSYCSFGPKSSTNDRFMVAVINEERKHKRRAYYDFYAPNAQDVYRPA